MQVARLARSETISYYLSDKMHMSFTCKPNPEAIGNWLVGSFKTFITNKKRENKFSKKQC